MLTRPANVTIRDLVILPQNQDISRTLEPIRRTSSSGRGRRESYVLANRLTADPAIRVALVEAGTAPTNARKAIVRIPLAMVTFMAPVLAFLGGPKFVVVRDRAGTGFAGPFDRPAAWQGHRRQQQRQRPDFHPRPA